MNSSITVLLPVYKFNKDGEIVVSKDDPLYLPHEQLYLDTEDNQIYVQDPKTNEYTVVEKLQYRKQYGRESINGYGIYYSLHHDGSLHNESSHHDQGSLHKQGSKVPIRKIIKNQHLCTYNPDHPYLFSVYKSSLKDPPNEEKPTGPFASVSIPWFKLDEDGNFIEYSETMSSIREDDKIRFTPSEQLYFDTNDNKVYEKNSKRLMERTKKEFVEVEELKYHKDENGSKTLNGYGFSHWRLRFGSKDSKEPITRIVKNQHLYTFNRRSPTLFSLYQDKKKKSPPKRKHRA